MWREGTALIDSYKQQDNVDLTALGVAADGDLIVSSRNTSTIYKVGRRDGQVKWRVGGKSSDFETAIAANTTGPYFAVTAHAATGTLLGQSATVKETGLTAV